MKKTVIKSKEIPKGFIYFSGQYVVEGTGPYKKGKVKLDERYDPKKGK